MKTLNPKKGDKEGKEKGSSRKGKSTGALCWPRVGAMSSNLKGKRVMGVEVGEDKTFCEIYSGRRGY